MYSRLAPLSLLFDLAVLLLQAKLCDATSVRVSLEDFRASIEPALHITRWNEVGTFSSRCYAEWHQNDQDDF